MVKYFRDFQTELQEAVANLVADQRSDEVVQGFDPERTTRLLMNVMRNPQTPAGLPSDFMGKASSNVRTGARGAQLTAAAVDPNLQEAQMIMAVSESD